MCVCVSRFKIDCMSGYEHLPLWNFALQEINDEKLTLTFSYHSSHHIRVGTDTHVSVGVSSPAVMSSSVTSISSSGTLGSVGGASGGGGTGWVVSVAVPAAHKHTELTVNMCQHNLREPSIFSPRPFSKATIFWQAH